MAKENRNKLSEDPTVFIPRGAVDSKGASPYGPDYGRDGFQRSGNHAQGDTRYQHSPQQGSSANYGRSYVNNSPNVRVVGYADVPDDAAYASGPGAMDTQQMKSPVGQGGFAAHGSGGRAGGRKAKKQSRKQRKAQQAGMVSLADAQGGRRKRRSKGAGRGCLSFLLALLLILAVPVGVYCFMLDRALALDPSERAAVKQVLEPSMPGTPYYALVLGSDVRAESGTTSENGRSDVILLMRIDPMADQVTMVTIPRDTPYRAADGTLMKVNETYNVGGASYTIEAVSEITGVKITHFAELGFSDLEHIVDALGGVTVDVDTELGYKDALTGDYVTIEPGTQQLTGQQAQIFARARHEYESQDAGRQSNVRTLVNACVDSVFDRPIYTIPGTVLDVAEYIGTDMKSYNIAATALPMAIHPGKTTVYTCAGNYEGDINPETGTWMCYEDPEGWANLMAVVDSGADPSA